MAETDTENAAAAGEAAEPSLIKKFLIPLVLMVLSIGGTLGGLKFAGLLGGGADPVAEATDGESDGAEAAAQIGGPVFFFSLYPDLMVNFTANGRPHFLKVSIDIMSRDEDAIKGVEEYHSILRNNLLMIFQQVEFDTVNGSEGMETMRAIALEEVKKVLATYYGNDDVEGVYFTSFVVQ